MRGRLCREKFVGRGEIANPDTTPWELLEFASSLQPTGLRPICLIYRYVIHEHIRNQRTDDRKCLQLRCWLLPLIEIAIGIGIEF